MIVQNVNAFDVRLDYTVNPHSSLFARYSMSKRDYDEPAPGNVFMGANNAENTSCNGVIGYTHTFGSNKFYEVRMGYNNYDTTQRARGFRDRQEQRAGHPQREPGRLSGDLGLRQLPPGGLPQHGVARASPTRSASGAPCTSPTTSPG